MMPPLNKAAAVEHVIERSRSHWRITIFNHNAGVHFTYDRVEPDKYAAVAEALREFETMHPECDHYGYSHGLHRVEAVHQ